MDKGQVVRVLQEMAALMEVESDNPFRARSYASAGRAIDGFSGDLGELIDSGNLRQIKGIGSSITEIIDEIWHTGESARHGELLRVVPPGVRQLLSVPGVGPKKVRSLWKKLGVTSLDTLVEACEAGRVAELSGFGAKSQQKILEGVRYLHSVAGRFLLPEAEVAASLLLHHLSEHSAVDRIELAGSLRRHKETVKDLDILVSTEDPEAVAERFCSFPAVASVTVRGSTKASIRLENGIAADLRMVSEREFPFALAYFTGSKEHNTAMRGLAKERGFKLNEYGLFPDGEEESLECLDEEGIYARFDLPYIVPELRENLGEIERATKGDLPDLLRDDDIRGVIHLHTTYSDGRATLEEMVEAARARGYSYMGVTDHSQAAIYAGGLRPEEVRRQHEEIDALNERLEGFRIFKGIESDIRADGDLDYDDGILGSFDFVIASLHASFTQSRDEMTRRVLRAVENPHTTMLGHLTARLLLRREPVAMDVDRILARAVELGVVVEINANPHRLDLDWRHGPRAKELGLLTSINPDAHSVDGIDDIRYGVGIARKAGFEKARVVNTLEVESFAEFCDRSRRGR